MNSETINQAYLFLIFILNGFIIGIIFDIFRILRKSFKTPNFVTYIEDTLFWIASALIVMYSLFSFNNGEFRAYIFIGIFLGITIYMLFFSKIIIKIAVKIILLVKKIITVCLKVILYPINILYKILKNVLFNPIIHISKKIYKLLKNLKNSSKKHEILNNKEGF